MSSNSPVEADVGKILKDNGTRLFSNGYTPIPCIAKVPIGGKGWNKGSFNSERFAGDAKPGVTNIGLLCGTTNLGVLDLDITDEPLLYKVAGLAEEMLGPMVLMRWGMRGWAALYRLSQPMSTTTLKGSNGQGIEWLANGRQMIAFGPHPKSGDPYVWGDDSGNTGDPLNTPLSGLPLVTPDKVTAFMQAAAKMIGSKPPTELSLCDLDFDWAQPGIRPFRQIQEDELEAFLQSYEDGERHQGLMAANRKLMMHGYSPQQTYDTLLKHRSVTGAMSKFSDAELKRDVGRCWLKLQAEDAKREITTVAAGKIDWPIVNPNTGKPTKSPLNTETFLTHNGVSPFHDEFAGQTYFETSRDVGELTDVAMRFLHQTAIRQGLDIAKEAFVETVLDLAHRDKRHPVRSYFESLTWDGKARVAKWLHTYGGAADNAYTEAISTLMLVAAVRRVMQPGCKYDCMGVLEGAQNQGKSLALRTLASNNWFTDSVNLGDDPKITIEQTRGKLIVEVAELQGMERRDVEHVKAFLSRQTDRSRLPYDRNTTEVPRQFIVVGTTNPRGGIGYLKDQTGNRRFLPVVVQKFDIEALARDRNQLWAEAVELEKGYGPLVLPLKLHPVATQEQENRRQTDPLEAVLRDALDGLKGFIPTEEIYSLLCVGGDRKSQRTQRHEALIAQVMKDCGWDKGTREKPVRRRVPGLPNAVRGYENDPLCPTIYYFSGSNFLALERGGS